MAQASESASAMEVDVVNAPPAFGVRDDKQQLQLPWVEKYRPKRYALSSALFYFFLYVLLPFICGLL
jgi:hypothetical protein